MTTSCKHPETCTPNSYLLNYRTQERTPLPSACDGYTVTPNRLRITKDVGHEYPWQLDAIDTRDPMPQPLFRLGERLSYHYTEQVWNFATFEEAVDNLTPFIRVLSQDYLIEFPVTNPALTTQGV